MVIGHLEYFYNIGELRIMKTLEYSIIYAMIRPEIQERVSIGIVFCHEGIIEVRYSTAKLKAVKDLVPEIDYTYLRRTLHSLSTKHTIDSVADIDYLNRYSNNIPDNKSVLSRNSPPPAATAAISASRATTSP